MKIRKAKAGDEKAITKLYYDLNEDIEEKPINLKSKYKEVILVAEEEGKVVGFISGTFIESFNYKTAYLDEFNIKEKYRGGGIGKALLEAIIKKFEELGVDAIFVTTGKENNKAINLYKKAGFKKCANPWFYLEPK